MKLSRGAEHDIVRTIEGKLRDRGFDPGETTGVYDEETMEAVADFQAEHGIQQTGTVDEDTLAELEVEVDEPAELPSPEPERERFRELLASNPNYFGNAPELDYEPVVDLAEETFYEELACVGYEPTAERLEAVVNVKRTYGYGGDVCTSGSPEYVRFYIDEDNDGTWDDLGLASFTAYDVPGDKPLEYGVSLEIDPEKALCFEENLPTVRAILSWNQPPPANSPNFSPVWGNAVDERIQVDPRRLVSFGELGDQVDFDAPAELLDTIDATQTLSLAAGSLDLPALAEKYEGTSVPPKRYGFSEVTNAISTPEFTTDLDGGTALDQLGDVGVDFDPEELVGDLLEQTGDTYYEELACVGLTDDGLNASFIVKRSNGYSGGLCSEGSEEYVAFWERDTSAGQWTHIGTTSVNVHDIEDMPKDGLGYAAFLPAPLLDHRQPCSDGASTVRIRATLSWETPPPPGDPYWTPTWGNSVETTVHVPPGPSPEEAEGGYLETVGKLKPCIIDKSTGLATGTSNLAGFTARDSPFGGTLTVSGFVADPPDVLDGADPVKYRVMVRPLDGAGGAGSWRPVRDTFEVTVSEKVGSGPFVQYDVEQEPDEDGFYEYLEVHPNGGDWRVVDGRVLVEWDTGNKEGKWELKLEFKWPGEDPVVATGPTCDDGSSRDTVVLRLDNTGPEAAIDITQVEPAGGSKTAANDCGKIPVPGGSGTTFPTVGDTIHGTFEATDEYFNWAKLDVRPDHEAGGATIDPDRLSYPSAPDGGEAAGDWKLDTDGMESCGFIARIRVEDRTVVNSSHVGWRAGDSAGFCLEEATETDGGLVTEAMMLEGEGADDPPIAVADHQFDSPGDDHENLAEEYVTVANAGDAELDLSGWRVEDEAGHTYTFPEGFTLAPDATATLRTGPGEDGEDELHWGEPQAVWNNTGDTVFVYDGEGELVASESY